MDNVIESLVCFSGICPPEAMGTDRLSTRYWFEYLLADPKAVHKQNTVPWIKESNPDFLYKPNKEYTPFLGWLKQWGNFYILILRPLGSFLFLFLGIIYGIQLVTRKLPFNPIPSGAVVLLSAGYLSTMMGHAITLTDNVRFSSTFDSIVWIGIIFFGQQIILRITDLYRHGT